MKVHNSNTTFFLTLEYNILGPRIAIPLSGSLSDVSVSICAVQLAVRTESKLYVLQDPDRIGLHHCDDQSSSNDSSTTEFPLQDSLKFIIELTGTKGVPLSFYSMQTDVIDPLGDILIEQAISCLVLYMGRNQSRQTRIPWLEKLQGRLNGSTRWFHGDLQVIMAPTWNNSEAKKALAKGDILS